MASLMKKLSYDPFQKAEPDAPTNEDFIHLIKAWMGPIAIYMCTADYNISVEVKKKSLIAEFEEYAPKYEPCRYRVNIVNYDQGKTLLLRQVN